MSATKQSKGVPTLIHYAVWYGPTWDEIFDCPVDDRNPDNYTMDKAADHFRFYDRLELDWEHEGEIVRLRSEAFNHSPYYVPGGRFLTDEEKDAAFESSLRAYAGQRDDIVVFLTRYRKAVALFRAEVEFIALPSEGQTVGA